MPRGGLGETLSLSSPPVGRGETQQTASIPHGRKNRHYVKLTHPEFLTINSFSRASSMTQQAKNLPAIQETQETQVRTLGQEDPLVEENGDPLQYFCLKNPMDRGTWWATVHTVAKNQIQLSD